MTTTQRHELLAWLGDDWTPEQVEQILGEYQGWERAHPAEQADGDLAEAVLTAIAQRVDGVLDVDELGAALGRARAAEVAAKRACQAATVALDLAGEIGRGRRYDEVDATRRLAVDRMTVRKWRGLR